MNAVIRLVKIDRLQKPVQAYCISPAPLPAGSQFFVTFDHDTLPKQVNLLAG